jgi:regulator of cell morphogenesis and NO signaling
MTLFPETTVGEVAAQFPATVRVFQRRKVEFCCGGHQTLAQVCRDIGTPYEILTVELEHAIRQAPARVTWADRPLSELTDHIVEAFHQPLLLELPRLRALITRLQDHGDAHRRVLAVVGQELCRFEAGLIARVTSEADELFPLIDRLEADGPRNEDSPKLAALRTEAGLFHQDAARTIRLLREITDGYEPPSNACATLRSLYRGLEEFEQLMQLYVHLETNVLLSRAAAWMCRAGMEKQT